MLEVTQIWILAILAGLAVISNYICFIVYNMYFDTRKCLFYILALDAGLSALASLTQTVIFVIMGLTGERSAVVCFNLQLSVAVILSFGPALYFVSSYIRYKIMLKEDESWIEDNNVNKWINGSLLITLLICAGFIWAVIYVNPGILRIYSQCIEVPDPQNFIVLLVGIPVIFGTIFSIYMDFRCMLKVGENSNGKFFDREQQLLLFSCFVFVLVTLVTLISVASRLFIFANFPRYIQIF